MAFPFNSMNDGFAFTFTSPSPFPSLPPPSSTLSSSSPSSSPSSTIPTSSISSIGDGFTPSELATSLNPHLRVWNPTREYDELAIASLVPGPRTVQFAGRVVNLRVVDVGVSGGGETTTAKAAGWQWLLVRDDEGICAIKLYYAQKPYPLRLGHYISVWTGFLSEADKMLGLTGDMPSEVRVLASIFPGRNPSDHLIIHGLKDGIMSGDAASARFESIAPQSGPGSANLCRVPLGYSDPNGLPNLMALSSYLKRGHDAPDVKILVCVKSIGRTERVICRSKGNGKSSTVTEERLVAQIALFDHTAEVILKLWGEMIDSVKDWTAGKTILLISNPGYKENSRYLGIRHRTIIDVGPEFPDTIWLKNHVKELRMKSPCLPFPEGIWDVEDAENGVYRLLFTLREVDQWAKSNRKQKFTGFLSVTITTMSLVTLYRKNKLLCAECCGIPHFNNNLEIPCPTCFTMLTLSPNPNIMGMLLDETGCVMPGHLLWSERAWMQLLGRSVRELSQMGIRALFSLEQTLLGKRIHLCFGWEEEVGRLAALGIS